MVNQNFRWVECGGTYAKLEALNNHNLTTKHREGELRLQNRAAMGVEKEVLRPGTGPKPAAGQLVTVHCTGYGQFSETSRLSFPPEIEFAFAPSSVTSLFSGFFAQFSLTSV